MSTIDLPEKYFMTSFVPRFRDADSMGHVNNSVFSTYIENSRFEWMKSLQEKGIQKWMGFILARAEIDFLAPIKLEDKITVAMWVSKIGTKSWDFSYWILDQDKTRIFAKIRSIQVGYNYQDNKTEPLNDIVREQLNILYNK